MKITRNRKTRPTQADMFYAASQAIAARHMAFLEMVQHPTNPMTREDLEALIQKRPNLWGRYAAWLNKLPSRDQINREI